MDTLVRSGWQHPHKPIDEWIQERQRMYEKRGATAHGERQAGTENKEGAFFI
jgi:hypothetical protein